MSTQTYRPSCHTVLVCVLWRSVGVLIKAIFMHVTTQRKQLNEKHSKTKWNTECRASNVQTRMANEYTNTKKQYICGRVWMWIVLDEAKYAQVDTQSRKVTHGYTKTLEAWDLTALQRKTALF